jgi:esterase
MTVRVTYVDKTVVVNGLTLHYLAWGDPSSPTLIALHGLRGHGHSWDSFSEPMSGAYHILALDQRGRGDSDWAPDGQYTSEAYVKDLEGFCEALQLRNFILMGHSMGGRNSMVFTARHPSMVNRLIIVDIGPEAGGVHLLRGAVRGPTEGQSPAFARGAATTPDLSDQNPTAW